MNTAEIPHVHVQVTINVDQALALAQFLKRVGWSEWRACAVDDAEAHEIRSACCTLQAGLAEAGFAPR